MILDHQENRIKKFNTGVYSNDIISTIEYSKTISLMRDFFLSKNFIEVPAQARLAILAACEDPATVSTFDYQNNIWPLPQTGQMWLEYEILTQPNVAGYFCISTSYRNEPNPIKGRHRTIFPMFEFETHGNINNLIELEKELVDFLDISKKEDVKEIKYLDLSKKYGVKELDDMHEEKMYQEFGPVTLLTDFPNYTSPFWNMRQYPDGKKAKKVDAIICGQETIGSAERAVDKDEMRNMFHNISDGGYAKLLYDKFGKERVLKELDDYLSLDFFERCGGGIGVTRMMRALKKCNKI